MRFLVLRSATGPHYRAVWIGANATTALYSWVKLADFALASMSAFNTVCCLLVFFIAGYKRFMFTRSRIVRRLAAI